MANGWNSESDREATLRRVAIVLSSLPAPVASQLLGSIAAETQQALRRTMTSLADVDPLERRRALQAFKVSVQQQPSGMNQSGPSPSASGDRFEGDASSAVAQPTSRVVSSSIVQGPTTHSDAFESARSNVVASPGTDRSNSSPLSFLSEVDDEILVRLLAFEHPQAVALVLASIAPAQAARVLPRLDPSIQSDALSRIGRLGEIPETAAAEIAGHFKNRLSQQPSKDPMATGRRALDAILAELPASAAPESRSTEPSPQSRAPLITPQVAQETPVTTPSNSSARETEAGQTPITPVSFPSADVPALDLTHKLRLAQHTWPNAGDDDPSPSAGRTLAQDQRQTGQQPADPTQTDPMAQAAEVFDSQQVSDSQEIVGGSLDSTDAIHEHLLSLAPAELCQSLGKVDTRDAMLALCGLPNEVTEAAIAILPRAIAKKVRIKMSTLGSLHLREIDEAKEKVARVSMVSSSQLPVAA
jgi:flagellar motor switch protein FliG